MVVRYRVIGTSQILDLSSHLDDLRLASRKNGEGTMALRNMCRCAARVVERDFAVVPTRAILPSTLFRGLSYNRGDSWVGQDAGGRGQDYNSGVSGRGAKGSYGGRNAANWRDGDW